MEEDVVLADEIVAPGGLLPPFAPVLLLPLILGPFDAGRQVTDNRFEPDVDALILVTWHGNCDPPFHIASDGPTSQPFPQHVDGEIEHIGAPVIFTLHPLEQAFAEGGQVQEEVFRLLDNGGGAIKFAARPYQFRGIQGLSAVIALIPASVVEPA